MTELELKYTSPHDDSLGEPERVEAGAGRSGRIGRVATPAGDPARLFGALPLRGPFMEGSEVEEKPWAAGLPRFAWVILFSGLAVREAFSFWTGHPFDFESWVRTGAAVAHGQNPYSAFWPPVPGVSFAYLTSNLTSAAYLPFWPLLLGGLYRLWEGFGGGDRFVLYFLLKQPGILADVATAYLLYRLTERFSGSRASARSVLVFWSFFPYAIVVSAIWGQFDSLVVVVLLTMLYARSSLERTSLEGVGILIKWVTVVFLPLELFRERRGRRLTFLVALVLPLVVTLAVFAVEGWTLLGFGSQGLARVSLSQSAGGGEGMNWVFFVSLPMVRSTLHALSGLYDYGPYLWVPASVLAGWWAARWLGWQDRLSELRAMLFVLLAFLLVRWGLYEQYLLYPFALLTLDVAVTSPGRRSLARWFMALGMADLLVNNDFGVRFLAPVVAGIASTTTRWDLSPIYGTSRTVALGVLAAAMTATLAQLLSVVARDTPNPRPWPYALARWAVAWFRRRTLERGLGPK